MQLISKFLPKTEFDSYEDFKENFRYIVPENFNFARDVVDYIAEHTPEKQALLYCNDQGEERRYTFSEISNLSKRAASYFLSLGIKRGDRVMTMLRRRAEYWICAVALHRIGAIPVPASIQFMKKDIVYRINTANAAALIYLDEANVNEQIVGIKEQCPGLKQMIFIDEATGHQHDAHDFCREYQNCMPCAEVVNQDNSAEFIAYFTSGTTNVPKLVMHNQTYPIGHIVTARYMQRVQDGGLHFTMSDTGWAKFGWGNIYGQWICESAIFAYDPIRFDPHNFLKMTEKYKPTSLCVPPTIYRFLLRDGLEKKHVASIQWFSTAGEPLSPEVNKDFERITGHSIHEGFGQSEGTPITCSFEWLEVRPGSMGKPSALYDVAIIDKEGNPCEAGEVGEVIIRVNKENKYAVGLTVGYFIDGKFSKGYNDIYHTGDMVYEDTDGYYWFVGRNDDMIKCSGYRIGPFEIETILNTHDAVKESAIIGRPDPLRGQIVCAVISLREGYEPSDALTKELKDYVKKNTAPYKYPRIIEYIPELPKTTSGKIIRKGL